MLTLLYYCLKVIICSGLLYGYYLLALRNNRFHHWNRYYLLAIIVVSFTLPLLQIPLPFLQEDERPVVQSFRIIAAPDIYFSTLPPPEFIIDWPMIAGVLYGCIVLAFVLLFIKKIFGVLNLKKLYPEENLNGIHFYHTNEPATPFSFFKNIFWNNSISLSTEKGQQMLRHELTHVQENHSIDKVAMELLIAVAWWNPFLYYIRKELSVIHEFIADQKASSGNDALQYASLLLMKAMGSQQYALGNPFFHSQLKRRLTMLTTSKNPRFSYIRRLFVLPLAAISLILFSFKYKEIKDKQKATLQSHINATGEDEFYGDTTKPKLYVQLNKTYKGSAIESIMPAADMSGAVVKTADDKTYFLDRAAAAKEFNFIITDSGFTVPPGAMLIIGADTVVVRNGGFVQMPSYSVYLQYEHGMDTTSSGLLSKAGISYLSSDEIITTQNQDMHIDMHVNNDSLKASTNGNLDDLELALVIVDGKRLDQDELKELDIEGPTLVGVVKSRKFWAKYGGHSEISYTHFELEREEAIARYGEAGKNGAFIIITNPMPDIPSLFIVDGEESTSEYVKTIDPFSVQSLKLLEGNDAVAKYGEKATDGVLFFVTKKFATSGALIMIDGQPSTQQAMNQLAPERIRSVNALKGATAIAKYGEKGSKGVVEVATRLATNEVTFPEADQDTKPTIKVLFGHKKTLDSVRFKPTSTAPLVNQPEDLKEMVVVGYQKKTNLKPVFTKVDYPASFPSHRGLDGWRRYLERHIIYPKAAQENGTQGTVNVQMTVNADGSLSEIKALNDPGNGLAAEAERVIAKGPRWIPATQNGYSVAYRFVQTLTFQLQ